MKFLPLLKMLRRGAATFGDTLRSAGELLAGAAVSLLTGRLAPKVQPEIAAKDALIICPSPLLNQQTINWERRSDYVIAFVNSACLSPTYLTLKPERYYLVDPAFFWVAKQNQGTTKLMDSVMQITATIANATAWPMTVYVPWHYRNSAPAQRMAANPMITVSGIPVFSARGGNQWLRHLGFRIGVLSPVYQNVLITAAFHGLKAGHSRVLLWGAHHTWLKDVEVDERNRVLHALRHTETEHERQPLLNSDGTPRLYHVYLRQLSTVFEQYHLLRDFAQHIGAEIINATGESYIDAFDRIEGIALFAPDPSLAGDRQ